MQQIQFNLAIQLNKVHDYIGCKQSQIGPIEQQHASFNISLLGVILIFVMNMLGYCKTDYMPLQ